MKTFSFVTLWIFVFTTATAQVMVDKQIQLTGPDNTTKQIVGVGNPGAADHAVNAGNIQGGTLTYAGATGSGNNYEVALSPTPAYTAGMVVNFVANHSATGTATLNVSGLGTKTIKKNLNKDIMPGDIIANQAVSVIYDGTNFQLLSPAAGGEVPAGTIVAFGGATAPAGWLVCDGSSLSRTTYAALFAAIGTAWGTANASSFNLPDLRGRFLRGTDGTANRDPDKASRTSSNTGGNTGNNVGSVQADVLRSHTHFSNVSGGAQANGSTWNVYSAGGVDAGDNFQGRMSYSGGNETRPINANVNYIIKM